MNVEIRKLFTGMYGETGFHVHAETKNTFSMQKQLNGGRYV